MYGHLQAHNPQYPADKLARSPQLPCQVYRPVFPEGPRWLKLAAPRTLARVALIPGTVTHIGNGLYPVLCPSPFYSKGSDEHSAPSHTPTQGTRLASRAARYLLLLASLLLPSERKQAGYRFQGSGALRSSLLPCGGHILQQQTERSEMPQTAILRNLRVPCSETS